MIIFAVNFMTRRTICGVQHDAGRRVIEGKREGASEQDDRFPPWRVFISKKVVRQIGPTPIAESVVEHWLVTMLFISRPH